MRNISVGSIWYIYEVINTIISNLCNHERVMLYDEWDKLLETRFVKKEDLILSGESITFRSYLVNLGELCQGHETTSVLNSQDRNEKVSETSRPFYNSNSQDRKPVVWKRKGRIIRGYQLKTPGDTFQQTLTVSDSSYKTENHSSYKTENAKLSRGDVEPRRSGKRSMI